MTPTRLRECLNALDWTQRGLARIIGHSEGSVRQWARGVASIPEEVADWLELVGSFMERNPAPERREARRTGEGRPSWNSSAKPPAKPIRARIAG